jgi:hypothetical protein
LEKVWSRTSKIDDFFIFRRFLGLRDPSNVKYGHCFSCDGKNYKVPEWFPLDKFDVDIAERLIEYKKKMSEMYCDESQKKATKPTKK